MCCEPARRARRRPVTPMLRFGVVLVGVSLGLAGGQPRPQEPREAAATAVAIHFERMVYPLNAKVRSIEGAVVLRGEVDGEGRVSKVSALSGPETLVAESCDNLKKWTFESPRPGAVIVVYWFRILGICEGACPSNFEFYPANIVVVSTGHQIMMP